jgi:hypothetical protein
MVVSINKTHTFATFELCNFQFRLNQGGQYDK